ncbi:MAG: polysaccharide export protein [Gammaproteobacteria bacterium]|nr:polysaccharide export protein [Gammaproteobacteria bacterium]
MQRSGYACAVLTAALLLVPLLSYPVLAQAQATETAALEDTTTDYVLGHGDRIRITVFGHENLTGEFLLSETDSISLPLVGVLDFNGATLKEAQSIVVDALRPDYLVDPKVSVEVLEYRPFYIIGEINNPGSYPWVNGMTVIEAVAIGGGFTYRARKKQMLVIRATDETRSEQEIKPNDKVLPGDLIRVAERFF